jgi:hypothetical protein
MLNKNQEKWVENYMSLVKHQNESVLKKMKTQEPELYQWAIIQLNAYANGELSEKQIGLLKELGLIVDKEEVIKKIEREKTH